MKYKTEHLKWIESRSIEWQSKVTIPEQTQLENTGNSSP
jgi:hypothetical protein